MVLTAIILSSAISAIQLMSAGLCLGERDGLGFIVSIIIAAILAFITYVLLTFSN